MQDRSLAEIFTDLLGQLTTLVRKESQLARVEMSENVTRLTVGLAMVVGAAILLIPALVILLQAGVSALVTNGIIAEPWAPLIVGGLAFLIGSLLALIGVARLKAENLVPTRTIHQIQSDVAVAKQQTKESYAHQRAA